MRVTFVCGSLARGRDGVGDYTRRLAETLTRGGHASQLIALNDRHLEVDTGGDEIRLPATMPWNYRIEVARASIDAHAPDWISVQFVPYGFANRGLVWHLGIRLRQLSPSRPFHLMFHELWIGEGEHA